MFSKIISILTEILYKDEKTNFPMFVLIISITAFFLLLSFYGFFQIIAFIKHLSNICSYVFLFSILFLIFSWVNVVIIESHYIKKISLDSIVYECSKDKKIFFIILNLITTLLLFMMIVFVDKNFIVLMFYIFYNFNEILFQILFSNSAKCVISNLKNNNKFNQDIIKVLKFYYLGVYKYILIFTRLIVTIFLIYIYFIDFNKFKIYCYLFPIIILINEFVYWTIRIKVYISINKTINN